MNLDIWYVRILLSIVSASSYVIYAGYNGVYSVGIVPALAHTLYIVGLHFRWNCFQNIWFMNGHIQITSPVSLRISISFYHLHYDNQCLSFFIFAFSPITFPISTQLCIRIDQTKFYWLEMRWTWLISPWQSSFVWISSEEQPQIAWIAFAHKLKMVNCAKRF